MNEPPSVPAGAIAAIIVNYNGGAPLLRCIDSIRRQSRPVQEIIVVDNDSRDGSLEPVRATMPDVRIIESGANLGWGVGCNIGIQATAADYLLLVNNDAYLEVDCVDALWQALQKDDQYGSAASRILLEDDPSRIEAAGVVIVVDGTSLGRGRLEPATAYNQEAEIFCANDCCCLYRRAMLDDIGLYDPDFFIYCDETDVGWRQQLAGWRSLYTPRAIAHHAHSQSAGHYTDFKAYHVERNRIYLCLKYFPLIYLIGSPWAALYRYGLMFLMSFGRRGALAEYRKDHSVFSGLAVLWRAHRDALRKAPVMWRRRREFAAKNRVGFRGFRNILARYAITLRAAAEYR